MDESLHLKSRLSHVSHVGWGRAGTTRTHVVTWVQHGAEPSRRPSWLPPQPVRRLPSWHGVLASEGLDVRSVEPMRRKNALGLTARDKEGSRDMAIELCRELWPQRPDLQDAAKLKKPYKWAEAFLIAAYGHASSGGPQGRLQEREPLSANRLARRKKGEESEPEPAPATPLATTAPPEAAPVTPAV